MKHLLNKEEAGALLVAAAEDWPLLNHILECPECQDLTLAEMASAMDLPGVEEPSTRGGRQTRGEAGKLLAELLRIPGSSRQTALQDPRFHRHDLLDLMLDRGEEAMTRDSGRATELALLAVWLGSAGDPVDAGLRPRMVRAYCLEANARRLGRDFDGADRALDDATFFLPGGSPERGPYCHALGLLRWEQGRVDEAAALLRHAARAHGEAGSRTEQGACMVLLGLLYVEMGEIEKAPGPLVRGRPARG